MIEDTVDTPVPDSPNRNDAQAKLSELRDALKIAPAAMLSESIINDPSLSDAASQLLLQFTTSEKMQTGTVLNRLKSTLAELTQISFKPAADFAIVVNSCQQIINAISSTGATEFHDATGGLSRNDLPVQQDVIRKERDVDRPDFFRITVSELGTSANEEVGRGGIGQLKKIIDPDIGRVLAVKSLQKKHRDNVKIVNRFVTEGKLQTQASSVTAKVLSASRAGDVSELGTEQARYLDSESALVMDYVDGVDGSSFAKTYFLQRWNETGFFQKVNDQTVLLPGSDEPVPITGLANFKGFLDPLGVPEDSRASWSSKLSRTSKLAQARINDIMEDALVGLKAVHEELGIVHRDLKPANLLISKSEDVYIVDFGLAKRLDDCGKDDPIVEDLERLESTLQQVTAENGSRLLTQADEVLGTPAFMAPEQVLDPRDADASSDIYSMGVAWYQLLTGKYPRPNLPYVQVKLARIKGHSVKAKELMDACYKAEVKAPHEIDSTIPKPLSAIIMKMMSGERETRYNDVKSVLEDYKNFKNNLEVRAYTETIGKIENLAYKSTLFIKTNPLGAGVGITLATLGLAASITIPMLLNSARRTARRNISNYEAKAATQLVNDKLSGALEFLVMARSQSNDWGFAETTDRLDAKIETLQSREGILKLLAERGELVSNRIINVFDSGGLQSPVMFESEQFLDALGVNSATDLTQLIADADLNPEESFELRKTVGLVFLGQGLRLAVPDVYQPRSESELSRAKVLMRNAEFVLGPEKDAGGAVIPKTNLIDSGMDMAWALYYRSAGDVTESEIRRLVAFNKGSVSALDSMIKGILVLKVKGIVLSYPDRAGEWLDEAFDKAPSLRRNYGAVLSRGIAYWQSDEDSALDYALSEFISCRNIDSSDPSAYNFYSQAVLGNRIIRSFNRDRLVEFLEEGVKLERQNNQIEITLLKVKFLIATQRRTEALELVNQALKTDRELAKSSGRNYENLQALTLKGRATINDHIKDQDQLDAVAKVLEDAEDVISKLEGKYGSISPHFYWEMAHAYTTAARYTKYVPEGAEKERVVAKLFAAAIEFYQKTIDSCQRKPAFPVSYLTQKDLRDDIVVFRPVPDLKEKVTSIVTKLEELAETQK